MIRSLWFITLYATAFVNAGVLQQCGPLGCDQDEKNEGNERFLNEFLHSFDVFVPVEEELREKMTFSLYFSRNNPRLMEIAQIDDVNLYGSYSAKKPTKILIHGWQNDRSSRFGQEIKNAYLENYDVNVIIVDWSYLSGSLYHRSKQSTPYVANVVAMFVDRLVNDYGLNLKDLHIIGHSLGAHISSLTAEKVKSGRVARVTGLDPALPLYEKTDADQKFSADSADFVDVIHTSGKTLGMREPIGKVDFFPNGGDAMQIGCLSDWFGSCSHGRAYDIYSESLKNPKGFMTTKCESWEAFRLGQCKNNEKIYIGENTSIKARGAFYLKTNDEPPYGMGDSGQIFSETEINEDNGRHDDSNFQSWVFQ